MDYMHPAVVEFLDACKKIAPYFKLCKKNEKKNKINHIPPIIINRYETALRNYRYYLDKEGHFMPKPKYHVDTSDPMTWIYKDVEISTGKNGKVFIKAIYNEDCPYYEQFIRDLSHKWDETYQHKGKRLPVHS